MKFFDKKVVIVTVIVLTVCFSLTIFVGCSSASKAAYEKSEVAYEKSEVAFENITSAYLLINEFSRDIYQAWSIGVYDEYDYNDEFELQYFANELNISSGDIKDAIASLLQKDYYSSGDWKKLQEHYDDSFFSACVDVVSEAYVVNGQVDKISTLLLDAKNLMKELGSEYSDYVHYPVMKTYYSNTLAFFDFCKNPEGSFQQVIETFNDYRNIERKSFFELNYIFEDSIEGFQKQKND